MNDAATQVLSETALARLDREIAKYPPDQKQSAVMAALAIRRELRDPMIDFLAHVLRQLAGCRLRVAAHRSISPNTMSHVPITATTSASMWPRTISSSAARCGKPGARIFSRYGLLAPSLTM